MSAGPAPGGRRFALALLAVVALGLAVRVAFIVTVEPEVPAVGDASAYRLLAEHLAEGHGYVRPYDLEEFGIERPTAEFPPLWPALLSVAPRAGIDSLTGQRLAAALVGSTGIALVGLLGRRAGGPRVGLGAALVLAVHPLVFQSDATLMAETLFVPLTAALLLAGVTALDPTTSATRRLVLTVGVGVLGGLATLTRAEAVLTTFLLAVTLAWRSAPARKLLLVAGGFALVLTPWVARNAVRLDAFVPVSNNVGSALDGSNCDGVYHGSQIGMWSYSPDCFDGFGQDELAADGEAIVAARHRDEGLHYARRHVSDLPAVGAVRILRTWGAWNPSQQTYVATLEGRTLGWERAGTALHALLAGASVIGIIALREARRLRWVLLIPAIAVTATALATYGSQRFRAGAEPSLAILAAIGIAHLTSRARARMRRS